MANPDTRIPSRPHAALAFALLLAGALLLGGCVNPQSNLSYSGCCLKSDKPYTCTVAVDAAGKPLPLDKDGFVALNGCGACAYRRADGALFAADRTTPKEIADCHDADHAQACGFRLADCRGQDGKNTCYLLDGRGNPLKDANAQPVSVAPICADVAPNPCIQNQCRARMCGEPVPTSRIRVDAQSAQTASDAENDPAGREVANAYKEQAEGEQLIGLVGKICVYEKMDKKASRLLQAKDWFVDALRLGVGGTFSDYDRARFYLPPSDFYCSRTNPNAVVDRYTAYLNGTRPLKEFQGSPPDFHAPLSACVAEQEKTAPFAILAYHCAADPAMTYTTAALGSREAAFVACNNACNANRFRQCGQNAALLTAPLAVSPPSDPQTTTWPFTDVPAYAAALARAYPTPAPGSPDIGTPRDPRNYYKPLLPPDDPAFSQNLLKPGAPGAKVFECSSDADCLSGRCDKSSYRRGGCFLKDGTAVDCGCRAVSRCDMEFICNAKTGIDKAQCLSNKAQCLKQLPESGVDVAVVCDYRLADYDIAVGDRYIAEGGDGANGCGDVEDWNDFYDTASSQGIFGLRHLGDFACNMGQRVCKQGGWPKLEVAVRMKAASNVDVCVGPGGTSRPACGGGQAECGCRPGDPYACANAAAAVDVWVDHDCDGEDVGWEGGEERKLQGKPALACPSGAMQKKESYRDDIEPLSPGRMRTDWPASLYVVGDQPAVAGPKKFGAGGEYAGFVHTTRWVRWQDDNPDYSLSGYKSDGRSVHADPKFKLITACAMTLYDPATGAGDIELLDPLSYAVEGVKPDEQSDGSLVDKTWGIRSFGKCQVDPSGRPVVMGYGICKPCGTSLTLAVQEVRDAERKAPYCPRGCTQRMARADAPSVNGGTGLGPTSMAVGEICDCSELPTALPVEKFFSRAGPTTWPDYGFLVGKIDEYQRANVLPLLDVRAYTPTQAAPFTFDLWYPAKCEDYAALTSSTQLKRDAAGQFRSASRCTAASYPDLLLTYLAGNHSAVILDAANLPSATDDPKSVQDRVAAMRTVCPDCMVALHHPIPITAADLAPAQSAANYPKELEQRVKAYAGGVEFDPLRMEPPADWPPVPSGVAGVSMLVLDIDPSDAPTEAAGRTAYVDALVNLSRRVLQHVGWPTALRIAIKPGAGKAGSPLADQELYKAIYARQRDLTLAGAGALILPPLDKGDPDEAGEAYADVDGDGSANKPMGRLLDSAGTKATVAQEGTPFCAAEAGSTEYLHPKVEVGLQKIFAKACGCVPCSITDIVAGKCGQDTNLCYDGSAGTDKNGGACVAGREKCEPFCINPSSCAVIDKDAPGTTTCTALRSSNRAPVPCAKRCVSATDPSKNDPPGSRCWPACDIQSVPLKELGDEVLHPDAAYLIAGLPHTGKVYCVRSADTKGGAPPALYTYKATSSVAMSSEAVLFPAFGANTSDCGRASVPGMDQSQVACGTPLPPVLDTLWTCTPPA